jgi:hypothetical protein
VLSFFMLMAFCNCFYLFTGDKQPLAWEMRVRVAHYIAQALDYCNTENRKIYHDLNAYRILFDEVYMQLITMSMVTSYNVELMCLVPWSLDTTTCMYCFLDAVFRKMAHSLNLCLVRSNLWLLSGW